MLKQCLVLMFFTLLFLSVSHLYPSLFSLCSFESVNASICPTLSQYGLMSLCQVVCVVPSYICIYIYIYIYIYFLFFSLSLSLALSLSLFYFVISLSLSLSLSASLSLSLYMSLSLSLSLFIFSLSLSLSIYLSVSQSLHLTCLHPGTVSPPIPHPKAFPPLFPQGKLLGILTGGATNEFCITARKLFLFLCFFSGSHRGDVNS